MLTIICDVYSRVIPNRAKGNETAYFLLSTSHTIKQAPLPSSVPFDVMFGHHALPARELIIAGKLTVFPKPTVCDFAPDRRAG